MHIIDAEWSKTSMFHERKKALVLKEKRKNIGKNVQVFKGYPCKFFFIFFYFRLFCIFFSFSEKNNYFGYGQWVFVFYLAGTNDFLPIILHQNMYIFLCFIFFIFFSFTDRREKNIF